MSISVPAVTRWLGQKIRTDGNGVSLSALAFLPVGPVDIYGRVGAFRLERQRAKTDVGKLGDNGTDLVYGAGVQFRLGGLSLRGEYERFDLNGTDVDLLSARRHLHVLLQRWFPERQEHVPGALPAHQAVA